MFLLLFTPKSTSFVLMRDLYCSGDASPKGLSRFGILTTFWRRPVVNTPTSEFPRISYTSGFHLVARWFTIYQRFGNFLIILVWEHWNLKFNLSNNRFSTMQIPSVWHIITWGGLEQLLPWFFFFFLWVSVRTPHEGIMHCFVLFGGVCATTSNFQWLLLQNFRS